MVQPKCEARHLTHHQLAPVTGIRAAQRLRQDERQRLAAPPDSLQSIATGRNTHLIKHLAFIFLSTYFSFYQSIYLN